MSADIIQTQYDQLQSAAHQFLTERDRMRTMEQHLTQQLERLEGGGWLADAAKQFYREMHNDVMPGVHRLVGALDMANSVTLQIAQILQRAEEEAAAQLNGGAGDGSMSGPIPGIPHVGLSADGRVPLYRMDFTDPNFDPVAFVRQFNTDRPVVFVVHGFNERGDYSAMADYYAQLGGEPAPIVVGVHWDSSALDFGDAARNAGWGVLGGGLFGGAAAGPGGAIAGGIGGGIGAGSGTLVGNYRQGEQNAMVFGQQLGQVFREYNLHNPNSSVNIIAHSLGNGAVMQAIATNDLRINSYVAVQAAVDQAQVSPGGMFSDVLNPQEVGQLGITYTPNDRAVTWAREAAGFDTALGAYGGNQALPRPNTSYYSMESTDGGWWTGSTNHYSYSDPNVWAHLQGFYGPNGQNLYGTQTGTGGTTNILP